MDFDDAFALLIGNEGKFTDNPQDSGNWTTGKCRQGQLKGTKYGISAASYPELDICNLTLEQAKNIYQRDFWYLLNIDRMPENIRFDLFDLAVNCGKTKAKQILQKALDVKVDGIIGPKTLAALEKADPQWLDKRLSAYRLLYLCDLKSFKNFGRGWVRRVAQNLLAD